MTISRQGSQPMRPAPASRIRSVTGRVTVWVRAWDEVAPKAGADRSPWKQDGVYLLTGGAGGIGLHVAEAIAASGVRPALWLTGRSHLKPDVEQRLKEIEALGATVHYRRIDVTSRDAVTDLLSEIDVIDGRLEGVFHGAGLTRDGLLATKDEATLREVLAPKVTGTRILDQALGNRPLDFLVLFASAAGALGNPGQSDYAAANAFLDRWYISLFLTTSIVGSCSRSVFL